MERHENEQDAFQSLNNLEEAVKKDEIQKKITRTENEIGQHALLVFPPEISPGSSKHPNQFPLPEPYQFHVQKGHDVLSVSLYSDTIPPSQEAPYAHILKNLAFIGLLNADKVAQSYGECECFNQPELATLLNDQDLLIRQEGGSWCQITTRRKDADKLACTENPFVRAYLHRKTPLPRNSKSFQNRHSQTTNPWRSEKASIRETAKKYCTLMDLPEFGKTNAYAVYGCRQNGHVRAILESKNAVIILTYGTGADQSTQADVIAMQPIIRSAFTHLQNLDP